MDHFRTSLHVSASARQPNNQAEVIEKMKQHPSAIKPESWLVSAGRQATPAREDHMNRQSHWEQVYKTKAPDKVSWFQPEARLSHVLITRLAPERASPIIDVGAGASVLVDELLVDGYHDLTVVDISPTALAVAQARLGATAGRVSWIAADLLTANLPAGRFDVWHDRAVFHFLADAQDRARYVAQVRHAVRPGGLVLVATFAADGPSRCSGLDVARYSPEALHDQFGEEFQLIESQRDLHTTPAGAAQAFTYCACRYVPQPGACATQYKRMRTSSPA
ncbi:MAG TPA: class I SAM-dependent methyltransferase [Anaerolineae bacterium]|nr:class I SAM-dependent methyltransferase [Anaerolineae bacterium]